MKNKIFQRRSNKKTFINPNHIVKAEWLSVDGKFIIQLSTGEEITLDKDESTDLMDFFDFEKPL
ncbi:hypothetical protein JTW20_004921 [Salmonella enterica]|uniref:hypothetical protein n=1 Tax=Salmonella enterica TaxID=28901 RepID=UPI00126D2A34|nr:hypothetical protein [Salmonella enterica]ECH0249659.1 hypothetical protein [Salmonella enterica]EGW0968349.1 hypothetical protein [Salmonella enterica]EHC2618988.1 hypothetical protein [Salmonella enterica]EHK3761786.1 hypothetical protein [Salmonella enterica]EKD9160641.1 hypothetical protein [Salmonella enterica]